MSSGPESAGHRVVIVTEQAALEQIVREILATMIPSASVEHLPLARAAASGADALVIDDAGGASLGATVVQDARARGFAGGIALILASCDAAVEQRLLALGPARCVARGQMATALPAALAALAARPALDDELGGVERELRRNQQLIAMGEATSHIQHTLNNPLTALLAEAQLLEMEALADEHRTAVKRIIELCRRMVGMVRSLDPGPR